MKYGNLYFNQKSGNYYFTGIEPCAACHQLVQNVIVIYKGFNRRERQTAYFCAKCSTKIQSNAFKYTEKITALMVDKVPKEAMPIFDSIPGLGNYNGTETYVFEHAATATSRDGERVVSRNGQCHNPKFGIQTDAKDAALLKGEFESENKLLENKSVVEVLNADKRFVSEEELDDLFTEIKSRVPVENQIGFDEQEKRLIE